MTTRRFLLALVILATAPMADAQDAGERLTRVVLLGTAGGPSAKPARAQPANAVIVDEDIYIVDAGDGIVRQLALGGYALDRVRAVFITHNHSDHVAGYGPLLLRARMSGRSAPIATYGPPPLERMTRDYLAHMRWDIDLRVAEAGRRPFDELIRAHDIDGSGVIYADDNVRVTAFLVDHGEAKPAYGYRLDTPDRSIVFSGDTAPSENLVEAAQGADILVHEVLSVDAVDAMIRAVSPDRSEAMRKHLLGNHSTPRQVGEIATAAGVHTLVLTHFGGTGHPAFDKPEVWEAAVRETWAGHLVVGEDLMVIR